MLTGLRVVAVVVGLLLVIAVCIVINSHRIEDALAYLDDEDDEPSETPLYDQVAEELAAERRLALQQSTDHLHTAGMRRILDDVDELAERRTRKATQR